MDNHYHLLLRTRDTHPSDATRWLQSMYPAVRHLGYRLVQVNQETPGLSYAAAAPAVKRFGRIPSEDEGRERFVMRWRRQLAQ